MPDSGACRKRKRALTFMNLSTLAEIRYDARVNRLEPALLLALIAHGEHGAVARIFSTDQGLGSVYIRGARGRRMRGLLQIGNILALDVVTRGEQQLPVATPYLLTSCLAMLHGAAALAMVEHACLLCSQLLPEGEAQPRLYGQVAAVVAAAGAGAPPLALGSALVRLELALLQELGLGLDLASCAATGTADDLAFVSPRSRQAVSRAAGLPWAARLLPLPAFVLAGGDGDAEQVAQGLALTGHFLERDVLAGHPHGKARERIRAARARLAGLLLAGMTPPG